MLSVTVPGNGDAAAWSGTFELGSVKGTKVSLNFNMHGNISAYGHLNGGSDGSLGSYQLVINGVTYDLSTLFKSGSDR